MSAPRPRAPSPGRDSARNGSGAAQNQRRLRRAEASLRAGATGLAVLGGLACYLLLLHFGLAPLVAGICGFVFALFGRVAALALARDWLLASARRAQPPHDGTERRDGQSRTQRRARR